MKKLLTILTLFAVMVGTAACGDSKTKRLKKIVEYANQHRPKDIGMIGDMVSIKYLEETNEVQYYILVNDDLFDIDVFEKNNQLAKQVINLGLTVQKQSPSKQSEEMDKVFELIIDANAGLLYTFKSNLSGKSFDIKITTEDLKKIYDTPAISNLETNKKLLECSIALENAQCPVFIDEGISETKTYDNGNNVVCECSIDEQLIDISVVEEIKDDLKKESKSDFSQNPFIKTRIGLCVSLGKGFIYRFIGNISGKSVDIIFTPEELREAINELQI